MVSHQIQNSTFRTELHEVQNIDVWYNAFEKSLGMYEANAAKSDGAGSEEQKHYHRILNSNFHSVQTMLVIFACESCNDDEVNVKIAEKR